MKGVIVAAGLGQPPPPLTRNWLRVLPTVLERPLIDYAIGAFAQAGFQELGVVLGPNEEILQRYLEDSARYGIDIYCLHNEKYPWGNATSVYATRLFVGGEPFIVALADYLITPQVLSMLLARPWLAHVLCVNRRVRSGPALYSATKVWLDKHGRVQRIGKRLRRWHAVDAGVFLFQPRVFEHLSGLLQRLDGNGKCSITCLARHMITSGDDLYACDVSDAFWLDTDSRHDLVHAQRVLSVAMAREELVA